MNTSETFPSFLSSMRFKRVIQDSIELHSRGGPSPRDYLTEKHRALLNSLSGKRAVFLDTNHWINLRHVVLGTPQQKEVYCELLNNLERAYAAGRLFCPVSASLMEELMKQRDPATRRATAQIMDRLSCGVCIRYPLYLISDSIYSQIQKIATSTASQSLAILPWTKSGLWALEQPPAYEDMCEHDRIAHQKVWIDLQWQMGFAESIQIPGFVNIIDAFAARFVDDSTCCLRVLTDQNPDSRTYSRVLRRKRIEALSIFGDYIGEALARANNKAADLSAVMEALYGAFVDDGDSSCMPHLQVLVGLLTIAEISGRRMRKNDMADFMHATAALVHCDAFFCDKRLADILRDGSVNRGHTYGTYIGSTAESISQYILSI